MKYGWDWRQPYMDLPIGHWLDILPQQVASVWQDNPHGDMSKWLEALSQLPPVSVSTIDFQTDHVIAGVSADCDEADRKQISSALQQLHPWRKGPYQICGIHIDTEWRSDYKWNRLSQHIESLKNRLVLDVGCGNGYHLWRMLGEGAELVIGIDPTQLFIMQFEAIRHFIGSDFPVHLFPLGIEQVPANLQAFDTVFSMGVFYHRQSPFAHLAELQGALRRGGELVLETLVIEGGPGEVLVPEGRYAKMRNVWFIPSAETLMVWLKRAGFCHMKLLDVSVTSVAEQRTTEWMRFESLQDYLDPSDSRYTVEGYPSPRRAIIVAQKK
ncbi:MAG: tRNA 5-methoxyuridine(34)/uridine 5-oxyacetic acid(34) synthase CmoB [Candidatus Thiodiazotropha sp.]|jgi:tRNA (mo5U34)-methyltransferase